MCACFQKNYCKVCMARAAEMNYVWGFTHYWLCACNNFRTWVLSLQYSWLSLNICRMLPRVGKQSKIIPTQVFEVCEVFLICPTSWPTVPVKGIRGVLVYPQKPNLCIILHIMTYTRYTVGGSERFNFIAQIHYSLMKFRVSSFICQC